MRRVPQKKNDLAAAGRNLGEPVPFFPGEISEIAAEEWLNDAVILMRSTIETDISFFICYDQLQGELTAYLSQDREGEPLWQKMQWKTGKEVTGLFSGSPADRVPEFNKIMTPLLKEKCSSLLLHPVQLTSNNFGLVGAGSFNKKAFSSSGEKLLELIGHNITNLWENKDRQSSFRKLRKEMDALMRFSKYLSTNTDDLEVVLEKILDELKSIIDVESCGVLLYNHERKVLVLQKPAFGVSNDQFTSYALSTDTDAENGIGVAVKVFLTGKPYICNMTDRDHVTNQKLARIYGARSSLSVPLVVDNRRTGVLHTINKKKGSFTTDDARLLELLAYQLAIVIENARLFKQLEKKNELLRHSMDVHNKLTRLVLRGKGFEEIIFTLAQLIERDIIVQDQFFKILGSHLSGEEENLFLLEKAMAKDLWDDQNFRKLIQQLNNFKQAVLFTPFPEGGMTRARLIAPIALANNIMGYVSILENEFQKLGEMEFLAIEHAVTVFTLKMMQSKIAYEAEERVSGDFLDDLLNGSYHSAKDMIQRASYIGCDLSDPYQVIYIDIDDYSRHLSKQKGNEGFRSQLKRRVFDIVRNFMEEKIPSSITGIKSDAIVVIAPYSEHKSLPGLTEAAPLIKERVKEMVPEITVSVGIGKVSENIDDIKNSYQEARRAIFIARKFGRKDQVTSYEALGAYKLLFSIKDDANLKLFVNQNLGPILEYDREKNNDVLITTIRQYIFSNYNNQKTADNLFIHLNTLKYRLQKIQDIAGIDLNDPETRLNLQLALKVLEIKNLS
ncbi:MAG: GAF domain-containing protein [Bacillota bacterium]